MLMAVVLLSGGCSVERFARVMVTTPNGDTSETVLAAQQAEAWAKGPFGIRNPAALGWQERRYRLATGIGVGVFLIEPLERPYKVSKGSYRTDLPGPWAKHSRREREQWDRLWQRRRSRSAESLNSVTTRILPPRDTVMILPGLGYGRNDCLAAQALFANHGYRAIAVDLRGQGDAGGALRSYGSRECADLTAVIDQLQANDLIAGRLILYGISYGGALALQLAARDARIAAVVAVAPYADLGAVLPSFGRSVYGFWIALCSERFFDRILARAAELGGFEPSAVAPVAAMPRITAPVLLLHGMDDRHVPPEHSQRLLAAAKGPTELCLVPHRDHVELPADVEGLPALVFPWLERVLVLGASESHIPLQQASTTAPETGSQP